MNMSFPKYTLFGVLIFSLLALLCYPWWKDMGRNRAENTIQKIAQKKPFPDSLKCSFLTDVLGLSVNKRVSLLRFNVKEGEKKLRACHIIQEAKIYKMRPSTLFIDYTMRKPIAYIADFANTAIDSEGVLFPFVPFYTPKNLPSIYLGDHYEKVWGTKISYPKLELIQSLLELFFPYRLAWIDLSHCDASTLGQKELVIEIQKTYLRMAFHNYKDAIERYFLLQKKTPSALKGCCRIDLRLPDEALLRYQP